MVCDNIAHGINLRKTPVLQYIYYLAQARSHHRSGLYQPSGCS